MSDTAQILAAQRAERRLLSSIVAAWRLEDARGLPRTVWGLARRRRGDTRRPAAPRTARTTDGRGDGEPHIAHTPAKGVK